MPYRVKEIFRSIQGEGGNAGRAAVFVRFSGCNLWSGRESDRVRGPGSCSEWCDTDFRGGRRFATARELMDAAYAEWAHAAPPLVVFTGGEPLLQIDSELQTECLSRNGEFWCETNGTIKAPDVFFVRRTVAPKAGAEFSLTGATEVKLVYPQPGLMPFDLERELRAEGMETFRSLYLQPMGVAGNQAATLANKRAAAEFCTMRPRWRLSLQQHKEVGLP